MFCISYEHQHGSTVLPCLQATFCEVAADHLVWFHQMLQSSFEINHMSDGIQLTCRVLVSNITDVQHQVRQYNRLNHGGKSSKLWLDSTIFHIHFNHIIVKHLLLLLQLNNYTDKYSRLLKYKIYKVSVRAWCGREDPDAELKQKLDLFTKTRTKSAAEPDIKKS